MTAAVAPPRALVKPRQLRDYQVEASGLVDAELAKGNTRTAVVLATGLGKTDVIAARATRAARAGRRVLIVAHRAELLDQITQRCLMHAPEIPVGRVQAGRNSTRQLITVAMAPTLSRAARRARMVRPDVVIVDECHHAASDGYLSILRWAGCLPLQPVEGSASVPDFARTPLIGVTATLVRGDKRELGAVFESKAIERGIVWAIEHGPSDVDPLITLPVGEGASCGWLVRPRGKVVVGEHLDLSAARTSGKDWQADDLGEMVAQDVEHIVSAWIEHGEARSTVAFVPSIAAARALADAFRAADVPVGEVYGDTPGRARVFKALETGRIRVLVNVMVATEGWDCPPVSCVLMARPTKLSGLYTQIVGRGLRPLDPAVYPGHPPKRDCLVLDVVGASRTAKLTTLADLLPGAEIDDVELDVRPCARCEGYTCRQAKAVALAVSRGMAPCSCQCEDCEELVAVCTCGMGGGRDPDGGRRRLKGRGRYAEVDLLALDQAGEEMLNWLATEGGAVFLSAGKRFATLREGAGGAWSAVSVAAYGRLDEQPICEGLSLVSTRVQVERWAQAQDGTVYGRDASWRRGREGPSDRQIGSARSLGIADPEGYTRGALSDLIDVGRASRRLDRAEPVPVPSWATARAVPAALAAPVVSDPGGPRAAALARARAWSGS